MFFHIFVTETKADSFNTDIRGSWNFYLLHLVQSIQQRV